MAIDWSARGPARERMGSENCFICGRANKQGLRLHVETDGHFAWLETRLPRYLQGFDGILHGGLVTALLDEASWFALYAQGAVTLTAGLEVRFRRPVVPETPIRAEGVLLAAEGRVYKATARIVSAAGELLAESTGRFVSVQPEKSHASGRVWREPCQVRHGAVEHRHG